MLAASVVDSILVTDRTSKQPGFIFSGHSSVASLGLLSPGAATEAVTLIFSFKN